jgi:hypothetical protein
MDPETVLGTGFAAYAAKDVVTKVLGPTAEYLGDKTLGLVKRMDINLDRIFTSALKKLGPRADQPGSVPPRVLKYVWDDGRFCEDELMAEYYGGILASSRSEIGRDDRGVALLSTVKELSTYQLRFHYLAYWLIGSLYHGRMIYVGDTANASRYLRLFIPFDVYMRAMDFTEHENGMELLGHCLFGLTKHNLIDSTFTCGSKEDLLQRAGWHTPTGGILVGPALLGAELFLWNAGVPGATGAELLEVDVGAPPGSIVIPAGATIASPTPP